MEAPRLARDESPDDIEDIDDLNNETFGSGAMGVEWELSGSAVERDVGLPRPSNEALSRPHLARDAVGVATLPAGAQDTSGHELSPAVGQMSIKDIWASSPPHPPAQASGLGSIWSSPQLPTPAESRQSPTHTIPSGAKVMTLDELERELTSGSAAPPPSSSSAPPSNTPPVPSLPPPPSAQPPQAQPPSNTPPPPVLNMAAIPPPHVRMPIPIHPHVMPWMLHRPLPPPSIPILPPHLLPLAHRTPPPPGLGGRLPGHPRGPAPYPPHLPPSHPSHPPPPHLHPPPPQPLYPLPPSLAFFPPPHLPAPPELRRSRRSELLGEMRHDGSGFMTAKEKEWVIKIQLLQLQTTDPATDDFYYQNYIQRKLSRAARASTSPHPPSSLSPPTTAGERGEEGGRSPQHILTLPQVTPEERSYKPIVFEGTLGKVSVSSISAPRQTIGVVSARGEGEEEGREGGRESRKRQALIIIEKAYSLLLSLEDLERRALSLPEADRSAPLAQKEALCFQIFQTLRLRTVDQSMERSDEQMFLQILSCRKGKRLINRALPYLSNVHAQAVLFALLKSFSLVLKRDATDQVLPELRGSVCAVASSLALPLLLRALSSAADLSSTALLKASTNEFGSSLLLSLVTRGRDLLTAADSPEPDGLEIWRKLTTRLHSELSSQAAPPPSPQEAPPPSLLHTLSTLPHNRKED